MLIFLSVMMSEQLRNYWLFTSPSFVMSLWQSACAVFITYCAAKGKLWHPPNVSGGDHQILYIQLCIPPPDCIYTMCMSMWAVSVVYSCSHALFPSPKVDCISLSNKKISTFPENAPLLMSIGHPVCISITTTLPNVLPEILQAPAKSFQLLLSCFIDNCFLLLTH